MANLAYGTLTITNLNEVTSVDVWYCKSSSPTQLTNNNWQTETPTWEEGYYIWSKTVTTWAENDTPTESQPVCITGQRGNTGNTGQSVVSITQQYALGSNPNNAPTTGWSTDMPPFETGKYYWTRSEIVWANPTDTTYTTAVLANGITSANTTAATANSNASAAVSTANSANTKSDTAISTANTANQTAQNAVSVANGKSTIYYSSSKPTGGTYKAGDTWFHLTDDGYRIYEYDTTSSDWIQKSMDGKSITAGTVTAAQIQAGAITTNKLATDAIKSTNYQAGTAPYSGAGTFLDLSNGNIYSPNFGINNTNDNITDGAYIKGSIYAYNGTIGQSNTNYWYIGNYRGYDQQPSAYIKGNGTATIQLGSSGTWRLNTNRIHTAWNDDSNSGNAYRLHYPVFEDKYWDMGVHVPNSKTDKFLYIRSSDPNNAAISNSNTLENLSNDINDAIGDYWNYQFYVTSEGNLYAKNLYILDNNGGVTQIAGTSAPYLLKAGGDISGNLTIGGTLKISNSILNSSGNDITLQTNLASTAAVTLTGNSTSPISIGITGILPSTSGGTGNTSYNAGGVVYADNSSPKKLLSTAAGTSGYLLKSGGTGAPSWVDPGTLTVAAADKFSSNRSISLTGEVTGTAESDGENGWSIPTVVPGLTSDYPYQEVEWVESNGKQFVYLDWKPPIDTWGFYADFLVRNNFNTTQAAWNPDTNANNAGMIFGTRNASGVNDIEFGTYSVNGWLRTGTGSAITPGMKTDKTRQQISLINTVLTKSDGTTVTVTRGNETANKPYSNMAVFAYYEGLRKGGSGSLSYPSTTRIYSLKFYQGETMVVNLVGAIRKRDGATGLYDKISKHFYPAPGMSYGDSVGGIGDKDTLSECVKQTFSQIIINNITDTRMWQGTANEIKRLEDGQRITVIPLYGVGSSTQTDKLIGWDDTNSNSNVFIRLTLKDNNTTDWIPCYYKGTTRLTTHYEGGTPIILTYRENVFSGASATAAGSSIMRCFYATAQYYYNTNRQYDLYSDSTIAGLNGVKRYSLCMQDENGRWTSIVNEANKTGLSDKTCYTGGLRLSKIVYHSASSDYASGANTGNIWQTYLFDGRYSLNGLTTKEATTTLELRKSIYLVGTIDSSNGLFYLDTTKWWTQDEPVSDDGKIYILLGSTYGSYYQMYLAAHNPVYAYKNGRFQQIFNAHSIETDVPPNAVFTDTTYEFDSDYNASTNKAATVSTVTNAINALDGGTIGTGGAGKTITALSQSNGLVNATFGNISITKSQVSDFPTTWALSSITGADDLKAIEDLSGTSGLLKKTAANTWTLDTSVYLTEITSSQITTALGYTPYNSTNPNGYTTNVGTVTQITAGTGLKIGSASSGGNITTSGTINHINSVTAQSTQALYPIKIDGQGHISAYGTAVTSLPASDVSAWAKAANKPSYTYSEIGGTPSSLKNPNALQIKVYNGSSTSSDISYDGSTANQSVSVAGASAITGITSTTDGKLQLTLADGTQPAAISVKITATTSDSAASADKLNLSADVGSLTQPVYFDANTGLPVAISYTIEKSVPSNAIFTDTTYTFDGTYNASSNKAATVSTVTNAINALDGNLNNTTPGAGKTLTAFSQTNGVVSATFGDISITKSQISDFPSTLTPASHTHGNITNDGDITTTVAIASGDRLVINDESEGKINNSSITFGTSTTTYLTNKGTWATPIGTTYTFDGTYNASTNKAATVSTVTNAINALDGGTIGTGGVGKTITSLSQTNGQVSATFENISITKSQISDFPDTLTPAAHTHGNISNTGTITSTAVALGNGDNLLFADYSNSGKIERSSITIGTGTTKYLRQDGTWGTPGGTYSLPLAGNGTRGGVQVGYTESGKNYAVKLDGEKLFVTVPWTDTTYDAATADPLMDGTAAVGTSVKYARQDHKHPSDTSRVPTSRKINNHALSADISLDKTDIGLGNVENTKLSTWTGSSNLTTTKVGTLAAAAAKGVVTTLDTSANLPTAGAVSTAISTALGDYVTLTTAQMVSGRKTFQDLATATFKGSTGSEYCNINYDQTLSALVFSFG